MNMTQQQQLQAYAKMVAGSCNIDPELYGKYDVKRGLRDINGKGVLVGLTEIADVKAYNMVEGESVPCEGQLFYRGYDVEHLVAGFLASDRFGFEETVYLLLFGELPTPRQLQDFNGILAQERTLPRGFVRDIILKASSRDLMNMLARSVLTLYSYDDTPDDIGIDNILRQSLELIARFPSMAVYGYQSFHHYHCGGSLYIHHPQEHLTTAENILHMLRPDSSYTRLEAKILDLALVLHAEHGGGNNSSFTTHVVSSSGTDTYSSVAASLGSLKGPRHGGANIKVVQMMQEMNATLQDPEDETEIAAYLKRLLDRDAFDRAGLIYGMGHAVYSLSDPRANVLKSFVQKLANEKGRHKEYALYEKVERLAPQIISKERKIYKGVSANIDFYSGFVYQMLDLPLELFTPIFAIARIAGWSAHRMEEVINNSKIIRPAYKAVRAPRDYVAFEKR